MDGQEARRFDRLSQSLDLLDGSVLKLMDHVSLLVGGDAR